jgi:phenylpropionate dioxygenase-like ring-hydroxylating dioxygenase large terminal subunit
MNEHTLVAPAEHPVAVWRLIEHLDAEALRAWRLAEVRDRPSPAARGFTLPHPFGWFVAGYSADLAVGEVVPLRYFDRDLVMWRGEDGTARIIDAYCRHLGAHLGYGGIVVGDRLECPFHGWRYDGRGAVCEIAYARAIPPSVKRPGDQPWPVVERNGFVWLWYHPDGVAPQWEVRAFAEAEDANWTPFERFEWNVWGSIQSMAENTVDGAHFQYVHGHPGIPEFEHRFAGIERSATMRGRKATSFGDREMTITYGSIGPGQIWTRFSGLAEVMLLTGVTPVAHDHVHLRLAFTQPAEQARGPMTGAAREFVRNICRQLDQDKVIWDRQRYVEKPPVSDGDGPIARFRDAYRQFYVEPAADRTAAQYAGNAL